MGWQPDETGSITKDPPLVPSTNPFRFHNSQYIFILAPISGAHSAYPLQTRLSVHIQVHRKAMYAHVGYPFRLQIIPNQVIV